VEVAGLPDEALAADPKPGSGSGSGGGGRRPNAPPTGAATTH